MRLSVTMRPSTSGNLLAGLRAALVLCLGLVTLIGCSAESALQVDRPKSEGIYPGTAVAVLIFAPQDEAGQRAAAMLDNRLSGAIPGNTAFGSAVRPNQPASYELRVTLQGVKEVSESERLLLNVFAGSTTVQAQVSLLRRVDSYPITQFRVQAESATAPLVTGNDLEGTVDELVRRILQGLR